MKVSQLSLVCLCLFGASQLAWSQAKEPTVPAIRGYLDPTTGKFTTRIAPSTDVQRAGATPESTTQTGTSLFFREDFQIVISNYDQPSSATAVCSVSMSTDDANGGFDEELSVTAKAQAGGWFCDAPILTQWTLQTPTQDSIYASVTITLYSQSSPIPLYRSSTKSYTLTVPGNTQTVVNNVSFQP